MRDIDHRRAYILGMLVGGGKLDGNSFVVDLPFKKWGMDPHRMSSIANDILQKIREYFEQTYEFSVSYTLGNGKWTIIPIQGVLLNQLRADLDYYGLPNNGFLLSKVDFSEAKEKLIGIEVDSFLSGFFDTRASLTRSHRRFTNDAPTVSIEIPGSTMNFKAVIQLCSWMTDLGSTTDQILFNHPNQHSSSDPYYKSWKKGFKIRFLVRSFLAKYSFALQSKSIDISKIEKLQSRQEQLSCSFRKLKTPSSVSIHDDQWSALLPSEVRGKLFFHYHHFCAVFGCPHAPVQEIQKIVKQKNRFVSFFPKLTKGSKSEMTALFHQLHQENAPSEMILSKYLTVEKILLDLEFQKVKNIKTGLAYLFSTQLKGKRHTGSQQNILNEVLNNKVAISTVGDFEAGFFLFHNEKNQRAFIVSSISGGLNQRLIKSNLEVSELNVKLIRTDGAG